MNVRDVAAALAVCVVVSGELTMEYPVMADPPLNAGAVHVTVAEAAFAVTFAVPIVGASGTLYGVTEFVGEEAIPVPRML